MANNIGRHLRRFIDPRISIAQSFASFNRLDAEHPSYLVLKIGSGVAIVELAQSILGFHDWLDACRQEWINKEACRKRCESALADLEMLEREVNAVKVKPRHASGTKGNP